MSSDEVVHEGRAQRRTPLREYLLLLSNGLASVRAAGWRLLATVLVFQLVIVLLVSPVLGWLFREALRASGMPALDLGALAQAKIVPLTWALLSALVLLAFWLVTAQFTAFVVLLRWPRLTPRQLVAELGRVTRKLAHPRSLSLIAYVFLLVPLSGFGFTSAIARGITIPAFVSGELLKGTSTTVGLAVFVVLLLWLNLRLALTIPAFVLTSTRRPGRSSWRLTRGPRASVPLALAIATVLAASSLAGSALFVTAIVPTALTDALAPSASPVVAAYSLGIAEVLGMFLIGIATALTAGVLVARLDSGATRLPAGTEFVAHPSLRQTSRAASSAAAPSGAASSGAASSGAASSGAAHEAAPAAAGAGSGTHGGPKAAVLGVSIVIAVALGTASIAPLTALAKAPESLVLGHRGMAAGGVENTIPSLEAAAAAGVDLVEMDVMQTKDGEFVAMHDVSLSRLAGVDKNVKDLTLAELTAIEVHDRLGHSAPIPSFSDYATRAGELEVPLLIEIKLSGAETPDHVERLVAELDGLGLTANNIYHSLDAPSVETLKRMRPDLTVGYTMAFAGVAAPATPADFIVVEAWTATEAVQQSAREQGLGFFTWTVNDEATQREHLRRGVDGIITDHPDRVLALRAEMQGETGLVDALVDALSRFVTVI